MARPSDDPTWATDTNYTSDGDSWAATPTRVNPGSARQDEGAEPDTFPAQWFNWIVGLLGDHIQNNNDRLPEDYYVPTRELLKPLNGSGDGFDEDGSCTDTDCVLVVPLPKVTDGDTISVDMNVGGGAIDGTLTIGYQSTTGILTTVDSDTISGVSATASVSATVASGATRAYYCEFRTDPSGPVVINSINSTRIQIT